MAQHGMIDAAGPLVTDAIDRCDRIVSDLVDVLGNLGAILAIDVEGAGRVTFTAGHRTLDRTDAVGSDDVFPIGSQSKTVTAMILLLMARDRLLDLDDPVHLYLDLPIDRRITIRHLLMNASGLGEYTLATFANRPDPRIVYAPRDLVALALPQGQLFDPGDRFDYCNTGWAIAAMIVEAVGGTNYGVAASARILAPLALANSGFGGIVPPGASMRCYMTLPVTQGPIDTTNSLSWAFGAGDGLCSAGDILAIYGSLLRVDSPLGITLDDLARETKKPSAAPYFALSFGTEYGLGIEKRAWAGSEVWGHPGSTAACRSGTWIDPSRRVAITLAVTAHIQEVSAGDELRCPRAQLYAAALDTAYTIAATCR